MSLLRRLLLVVATVLLVSGAAYGVGAAGLRAETPAPAVRSTPAPPITPITPITPISPTPPRPAAPRASSLLGPGDRGPRVRALQARLAEIDWYDGLPTARYDDPTVTAVRGFQAKRNLPATGVVDRTTMRRLRAMTTTPSPTYGALDARCTSGRALCIDKTTRTLRWVVDGRVLQTLDTRFGGVGTETREGLFDVYLKSRDHVSRLYGSAMPYAMFFSGGQAVHYSSDFAAVGYAGASHGCVNVRDRAGIARLFDQVRVGDPVVVYRS